MGYLALTANTTGTLNTALGSLSLDSNTTGSSNTALGYEAGETNVTGNHNTFVGRSAGKRINNIENTCIGAFAGQYISATAGGNGLRNTIVGAYAGDSLTTGQNVTCIGYDAEPSGSGAENQVVLGNTNINQLRCAVTSITSSSDERDKTDIIDIPDGLQFLNKLRPVKFKWQNRVPDERDGKVRGGFIAQELEEAQTGSEYLNLVFNENPDKLEATQGNLIPVLVKAIQELSAEVEQLKSQLNN